MGDHDHHDHDRYSCSRRSPSPPRREKKEKRENLLDIIGSHKDVTIIGHVNVIKYLPFKLKTNLYLLDQYYDQPGTYYGRAGPRAEATAKVIDYGNDFLALKLFDDITRPELGEFLVNRGWNMIGYASAMTGNNVHIMEKWCSKD